MFFLSVEETPSPSLKSSDDIIDDSDDDTTGNVKRKVCNSTYATQTTNYVHLFNSMSRASQESCTVLMVPVATYTLQINTVSTFICVLYTKRVWLSQLNPCSVVQDHTEQLVNAVNHSLLDSESESAMCLFSRSGVS